MITAALFLLAAPFHPVADNPEGVWQSQGYGYVLELKKGQPTLYHQAGGLCIKDPRGGDPDDQFRVYQVMAPDRVAFSGEEGGTHYIFDRLPALPAECASAKPLTPQQKFDFVVANLRSWYPQAERRIDIETLVASTQPIADEAQLWAALERLYTALDDPHSELHLRRDGEDRAVTGGQAATLRRIPQDQRKSWLNGYRDGILERILQGQGRHVGNNRILWGT